MAEMVPVTLDAPKVHHIPAWDRMNDKERVALLRKIAESSGRDPRLRAVAHRILGEAGVDQRQYRRQADAFLRWIHREIAYLNEPGEILQDPLYTLKMKHADCDDMALLLAALCESVRLPWRFVLSGTDKLTGEKKRWIEGTRFPSGVLMAHIYVVIGWPPYQPTAWAYAEPTIKGFPLGMDVVQAANGQRGAVPGVPAGMPLLPELAGDRPMAPMAPMVPMVPRTPMAPLAGDRSSALLSPGSATVSAAVAIREDARMSVDPEADYNALDALARQSDHGETFWGSIFNRGTLRTIVVAAAVGALSTVVSQAILSVVRKRGD